MDETLSGTGLVSFRSSVGIEYFERRRTVHTDPLRGNRGAFLKTLFKPKKFETPALRFGVDEFKEEAF